MKDGHRHLFVILIHVHILNFTTVQSKFSSIFLIQSFKYLLIPQGPFYCDICEKKCDKWNQYLRHLKTHDDDKPFRCFSCPETFNIAENLRLHLATHVEPGAKPTCPDCGKKFSRVASLKAHIMMHEREESLMCTECGDEFATQVNKLTHIAKFKFGKTMGRT